MDEQAVRAPDGAAGSAGRSFERLTVRLRRARRWYSTAAAALITVGLGAAAAGLLGLGPVPVLVPVGLLAAALSALPWCLALDRRDRADGVEALADEWAGLSPGDEAGRAALLQLVEAAAFGGRGRVGVG